MFVEAFHRVLKVVYLEHKQNRRIDFLLYTLMKVARDEAFERLLKQEKGKNTHRVCEINKRHKAAQQMFMHQPQVTNLDEKMWKVRSQHQDDVFYHVKRLTNSCNCKLSCTACKACVHQYSCSCLDATIHTTVCKHIHLVHMMFNSKNSTLQLDTDEQEQMSTDDFAKYFHHRGTIALQLPQLKESVQCKMNELQILIQECTDSDALNTVSKHLQNAITVVKAMQQQSQTEAKVLPIKRHYAPNANHEKQLRFFSTKRKRTSTTSGLGKPTLEESKQCKSKLTSLETRFCAVCLQEDDCSSSASGELVTWLQCSICTMWVRIGCTQHHLNDTLPDDYICNYCAEE